MVPSTSANSGVCITFTYFINVLFVSVPYPVSGVGVAKITTKCLIAWIPPIETVVSQYNVVYFNITCPSEQHSSQSSSVIVNSSSTTTLVSLQPGQLYNISVIAINAVGQSSAVGISYWTPSSQGESTNIVSTLCIMRHSVPSAPPEMVNVSSVHGSSSITIVRWGEVPCQHRNGEIIRYAVKYIRGQNQTQGVTVMVDGHATTLYLEPLTEYSIMVAAVNSNGTGQFSEPVYIATTGQQGLQVLLILTCVILSLSVSCCYSCINCVCFIPQLT